MPETETSPNETPSTHESLISGLVAGHESKLNAFKKLMCCQATQEGQLVVAAAIDDELARLLAAMEARYPV